MTKGSTIYAGIGVSILIASIAASTAAHADDAKASQQPNGARKSDAVIVRGTVTRDGKAIYGADVDARIWPTAEALSTPGRGLVNVLPIGKVKTDTLGHFKIELDPSTLAPTYRDDRGSVDVQLSATANGGSILWNFTAIEAEEKVSSPLDGQTHKAAWSTTYATQNNNAPENVAFDFGDRPSVSEVGRESPSIRFDQSHALVDITDPVKQATSAAKVLPMTGACNVAFSTDDWMYDVHEYFDMVRAWDGAKATYEQSVSQNSEHTLGITYKPVGGTDWSVSGQSSLSISTGFGQSVSGLSGTTEVSNSVNYRRFDCLLPGTSQKVGDEWRVVSLYDLFREPFPNWPSHVKFSQGCAQKSPGVELWKETGRNKGVSAGVDLGIISLDAKSGYDSGTRIKFSVTQPSEICGDDPSGWVNATRVEMHQH